MKTLLILALCVLTASAAHVFLTAPPKKVQDSPTGLIFESVKTVFFGQSFNSSANLTPVTAAISSNNSQIQLTYDCKYTVPNNYSLPLSLNLTVNYGYPWTGLSQLDSVVVVLDLNASALSTVNSTQNLTYPSSVAWANISVTKQDNFTTFGNITLMLNVGNVTDQVFNVFLTSLNFSKSFQTKSMPQLAAPWSYCQVGTVWNGTIDQQGVDFSVNLTDQTGFVNLSQSKVNITWNNDSTDAQDVNVTFLTSYTYPETIGVNSTMTNVSQILTVNFTYVNSSSTWPNNTDNTTGYVTFNITTGVLVQMVKLGMNRTLSNVTGKNITTYTLGNLSLSSIQIPQTLDLTKLRLNNTNTTVSAVISYNKKSSPQTLKSNDNGFGVLLPSPTSNGAISLSGTRSSNVSLWINFIVTETYQNTNVSQSYVMPFNISNLADQIGDFTSNNAGIISTSMYFPFNLTVNEGGETDWFNVSFTVTNTTTPEAYFSGWKFNLLNLTVNQVLIPGENAKIDQDPLTPVMLDTGSQTLVDALSLFDNQTCTFDSSTTVTCSLATFAQTPQPVTLQNVTVGGPSNITLNVTGLNVTYDYSNVLQLLPNTLLSWNVSDVFTNKSVSCKTNTTGNPYLPLIEICGQWQYNVDPKVVNLTVFQFTNMSLTFNSYQNYSNRANLTQSMIQTLGLSVQNQSQSNSSISYKGGATQFSLGLPDHVFQVSNQTDKIGANNLNLTIVYNISQTYSFNVAPTVQLKDTNNTSTQTISWPGVYEIDALQTAMNSSLLTTPSNNNTQFSTLLWNTTQQWTQFDKSTQGYGAYYSEISLSYGATGFVELTAPSTGLGGGAIAGIVIGCIAFIAILGVVIYCVTKKKDQDFYTKQNA